MAGKKTNESKVVVAGHWEIGYSTPIVEAH
jgi:hypothetical protein